MTEQQSLRSDPDADSSPRRDDLWRSEIADRIAGYRHRRGRRVEGAFSMRFPFPPTEADAASPAEDEVCLEDEANATVEEGFAGGSATAAELAPTPSELPLSASVAHEPIESGTAAAVDEPEMADLVPDTTPESDPPPALDLPLRPRGKRKIIAFPRQASAPPESFHRLADPVVPEQPRILDVPEELEAFPTTPLLDGLQLPASAQQSAAAPADHIVLPFQAADLSRRVYAGLIDCALVAAGAAIFGAVSYKMLPGLPRSKPVMIAGAAVVVVLWAVYQYLFTMYGGATPGMRMMRMRLSTFKGGCLSWRRRRSRVIGLYFSTASLMMGLFWGLVDVDALCWHDRISRTYLAHRE